MELEPLKNKAASAGHLRTTWRPPDFLAEEPCMEEFRRWRRQVGVCADSSFTYFAWGRRYHLVKIGCSFDPPRRAQELSLEHHQVIEMVASVRGDFEICYHRHFAEHRLKGEWFEPHDDILEEIKHLNLRNPSALDFCCLTHPMEDR